MIIVDLPIYTMDGDIVSASKCDRSLVGHFTSEKVKGKEDLVLVKTASFGPILLSKDACIVGGGMVRDLKLFQDIILQVDLQFGTEALPTKFLDAMNELEFGTHEAWKATKELTGHIKKLLKLREPENRVALRYARKLYEFRENKLMMRGTGHANLMKAIQIIAWKAGLHASYEYANSASILTLKEDCPYTIISRDENKITSKIIELKHISQFKSKLVKITSTDLPILPTTAGMFTF